MPALVLFAFGLLLQLVFVFAGPDGGLAWHIGYQGDAPVWQELAQKVAQGAVTDELRLPLRPPGMQWLVTLLWDGNPAHALPLRILFAVLGASVAPLIWLLLRRAVAANTALLTAGLCATAGNLLLLGSGVHVELVYLVGVLVALIEQPQLARASATAPALRFGLLHGLLCLLRAEHVLTVAALLVVARWTGSTWRTLALATAATAAVIAPWQWHANGVVAAYNQGAPELAPAPLPWDAAALARLRTLPSFQQGPVYGFVTDTMRVRGARVVAATDLDVVREAYGCWPEPLRPGLIAIYGGLNFFLANTPEADGGFSAKALDRPPPLAGGDGRYPPGLRRVLPQGGDIRLSYPPHLDAVVRGTARGFGELTADPLAAAVRCAKKLWHALQGATPTIGGYALPIGLSGERRQVDLVTATGTWPALWRLVLLAAAATGLWHLRRERALWPLFAFAATKLLIVLVYFGYARHGALCLPVLALGVAALLAKLAPRQVAASTRSRIGVALLAAVLALELVRAATTSATVDGVAAGHGEPFGPQDFAPRPITFR
ncbi:MAG: hypothetical protein WAT39_05725 [Planctomycetota bacterium]